MVVNLLEWNSPGVWGLRHKTSKKIFLSQNTNRLDALIRTIKLFESGHEKDKDLLQDFKDKLLEPVLMQESSGKLQTAVAYFNQYSAFKNAHYHLYRTHPIRLEAQMSLLRYKNRIRAVVKIVRSQTDKGSIVGLFEKVFDAEKFIRDHYQPYVAKIIYADNELTKEFFSESKET